MVTTNRDDVAERVKMLRNQGMRRRYHHDELGWNARMDGFQGAVLTIKLKHIGAWNETRCELAARYGRMFHQGWACREWAVSGEWVGSAASSAGDKTCVASICDSRGAA